MTFLGGLIVGTLLGVLLGVLLVAVLLNDHDHPEWGGRR